MLFGAWKSNYLALAFGPNRLNRIAVPSIPAPRAKASQSPRGSWVVSPLRKAIETGVPFWTERIAIAITKTAGIATTKNFTTAISPF